MVPILARRGAVWSISGAGEPPEPGCWLQKWEGGLGVEGSARSRPAPSEQLGPAYCSPGQAHWTWGWVGYQVVPGASSRPGHTAVTLRVSTIPVLLSPPVLLQPQVTWPASVPRVPEDTAAEGVAGGAQATVLSCRAGLRGSQPGAYRPPECMAPWWQAQRSCLPTPSHTAK